MVPRALSPSFPGRVRRGSLACLDDLDVHSPRVSAVSRTVVHNEAVAPSVVRLTHSLPTQRAELLALVRCRLAVRVRRHLDADDYRRDLNDMQSQDHAGRDLASVERQARVVDADDLAGLPCASRVYGFHGEYFLPSNVSASPHRFGSRVPQIETCTHDRPGGRSRMH